MDLTCKLTNSRVIIKFSTEGHLANWLRAVAEFTTKTRADPRLKPKEVKQETVVGTPVENIKFGGAGHTGDDELSSRFGL